MGFNFDVGVPIPFGEWFVKWISEAPIKELIWDSVLILWLIWCIRNEALFQHDVGCVDNALARFLGLRSLCRSRMIGGTHDGHGVNGICEAAGREGRVQFIIKKRDCEFYGCQVLLRMELGRWAQVVVRRLGFSCMEQGKRWLVT